jgi:hypothetical protein
MAFVGAGLPFKPTPTKYDRTPKKTPANQPGCCLEGQSSGIFFSTLPLRSNDDLWEGS